MTQAQMLIERRHQPAALRTAGRHLRLGVALIGLGVALAVNSVLGPLFLDAVRYPFSETLMNQTIGLEAFSFLVVAPLAVVAGVLVLRRLPLGPVLGFGVSAYTAYMFLQYVVGPEYTYYPAVMPLHIALFAAGVVLAVKSWNAIAVNGLLLSTPRTDRWRGVFVFALAAFLVSRYVPMLFDSIAGRPLTEEFASDVSMFWTIFLLDLGVVLPATIAVGVALVTGAAWRRKGLFALIAWWALVPPSIAAMALAMVARNDPFSSVGQTAMFVVVAVAFVAFAVVLYRPLFSGPHRALPR